jgi:DNA-binding PucR family transcriptional regulator
MPQAQRDAIGRAHKGQRRSEEARASMKAAQQAKTDEARALKSARISAATTGRKLSVEHRKKISEFQRGKPKNRKPATSANQLSLF